MSGSYISADGHRVERTEPRLCWSDIYSAAEGLPKEISLNDSWACFDGSIEPLESGEYTFNLLYAGYVRLLADGKEVIPEIWRTTINPNVRRFTLKLEKGKKLPARNAAMNIPNEPNWTSVSIICLLRIGSSAACHAAVSYRHLCCYWTYASRHKRQKVVCLRGQHYDCKCY